MAENSNPSTVWLPPLPFARWTTTTDSWSFRAAGNVGEIPLPSHVAAFGVQRANHFHEGLDFYAPEHTEVCAVEDGVVVVVEPFTGPLAGSPWWLDTHCVMVEGASGVVVYGEIQPGDVRVGQRVNAGHALGWIKRVLAKDKGRPRDMLHLELHTHGARVSQAWNDVRPQTLCDPTPFCTPWATLTA